MLFDTHAHYDDERFDEDRDTLLASMPENNVGLILNPGCDVESSRKAVSYANKYPFVYAAVGIHPENIEDGWEADLETIRALAQNEGKVRAIGEIGLDYYWEKDRFEMACACARQPEYITDFAEKVHTGVFSLDAVAHMDDEDAIRALSSLKGIGVWTAEMIAERISGLPQLRFCRRLPAASQVRAVCIPHQAISCE